MLYWHEMSVRLEYQRREQVRQRGIGRGCLYLTENSSGFPSEHLTIGRVRGGRAAAADLAQSIEKNADYAAGQITVTELVLFSSQLQREGPIYTALGRSRLGGS